MYNCQKQITRVLKQFDDKIVAQIEEILIVNNRSTDQSEEVSIHALNLIADVNGSIVRNMGNYGLGGSHKVAFDYAMKNGFDYVIVLHGDDQGSIHDILPYLQSGEITNYDCYLGARFHPKSKLEGYSAFRTWGNHIYNLLFSIISGKKIYDLGAGLNCYNVKILQGNFYIKFPDDLTFNYCMILAHIYYGHNYKFFPLTWREDDQVSNVKMFRQACKVLGLLGRFAMNKRGFLSSELRQTKREYQCSLVMGRNIKEKAICNGNSS